MSNIRTPSHLPLDQNLGLNGTPLVDSLPLGEHSITPDGYDSQLYFTPEVMNHMRKHYEIFNKITIYSQCSIRGS